MSLRKKPRAHVVSSFEGNQPNSSEHVIVTLSHNYKGQPTKMSDLFTSLPHGIFDKSITGLGGTTLELDSARPSIVVEPLNVTAFSKAQTVSRTRKLNIHYYGTAHNKKENPKFQRQIASVTKSSKLNKYLKACKESGTYPKLTCVADQLARLRAEINESEHYKFEDFHLLLDEIDSMQEQTDFRKVMEECVNVYKSHPRKKRTMLSATINTFHDPELKTEPKTKVLFEDFKKIPVTLHHSGYHPLRISRLIEKLINEDPDCKVVIALNHIKGIKETIQTLINFKVIEPEEIKVLSSEASQEEFPDHYYKLTDGKLPTKVSFMTAAYFSGLDINEHAHLIMSVDAGTRTLQLSTNALYQIQGRLRQGLDSCHIVCDFIFPIRPMITSEDVLEAVEVYKPMIALFNTFKKSKSKFIQEHASVIENIFTNGYEKFRSIWSRAKVPNEGTILTVSYLKIDSFIEDERTRFALSDMDTFKKSLDKFFQVIAQHKYNDEASFKLKNSKDDVLDALRTIKGLDLEKPFDKGKLLELLKATKNGPVKDLIQLALNAFGKDVFNLGDILPNIETLLISSNKWESLLEAICLHVEFHALFTASNKGALRHFMYTHFSKMNETSAEAFNEHIRISLKEAAASAELESGEYTRLIKSFSPHKFIRANMNIEVRRDNKRQYKKITSFNPYGILNLEKYKELDYDLIASGKEALPEEWKVLFTIHEDGSVDNNERALAKPPKKTRPGKSKVLKTVSDNIKESREKLTPSKAPAFGVEYQNINKSKESIPAFGVSVTKDQTKPSPFGVSSPKKKPAVKSIPIELLESQAAIEAMIDGHPHKQDAPIQIKSPFGTPVNTGKDIDEVLKNYDAGEIQSNLGRRRPPKAKE